MNVQLVTAPKVEPVTLADVKQFARVTTSDDDALLSALITAARKACERFTRRVFMTQTWMAAWDAREIQAWVMPVHALRGVAVRGLTLPKAPLQSVTSVVSYALTNNAPTTFSAANYYVDTVAEPGRLELVNGATWPMDLREINALQVTYVCGYGGTPDLAPDEAVQAIKMLVTYLYENRGDDVAAEQRAVNNMSVEQLVQLPKPIQMILGPLVIKRLV